jgi:hypothetical protein
MSQESDFFKKGYCVKYAAWSILALFCMAAIASEAPWYKWQNQEDNTVLCAQTPPGEAWNLYDGPYMESRCKKRGNP